MTLDISGKLEFLTNEINKGILSGSVFLGDLRTIQKHLYNYHPQLRKVRLQYSEIEDAQQHVIRCYRLRDRDVKKGTEYLDYYLVRVDSSNIYTPWDRTDDIDIKDTVELAVLAYKRKQDILIHATKAAMAAIMTRNMSHNIGSHVISYWNHVLDRLDSAFDGFHLNKAEPGQEDNYDTIDNLLKSIDCLSTEVYNLKKIADKDSTHNELQNSILSIDIIYDEEKKHTKLIQRIIDWSLGASNIDAQTKAFLHYLQQRMDFIAEIVTSSPSWERTMNIERDIINPFRELMPLMSFIAYSENLSAYESQKFTEEYFGIYGINKLEIKVNVNDKLKRVSIPHGTVGVHAFYSILENFIRNSAKHGMKSDLCSDLKEKKCGITISKPQELVVTVALEEINRDNDSYLIKLTDNLGNCSLSFLDKKIRRYLKGKESHLVDSETGIIKSGGWGIKEMKISANFLMMKDSENLMNESYHADIISPICTARKAQTNCALGQNLGYKFKIMKPKDLLIVNDLHSDLVKDEVEDAIFNIDIWERDQFLEDLSRGVKYKFVLIETLDQTIFDKIRKNREKITPRILYIKSSINSNVMIQREFNRYYTQIKPINNCVSIRKCYREYIRKLRSSHQLPNVFIRDTGNKVEEWNRAGNGLTGADKLNLNDSYSDYALFDRHGENIRKFYKSGDGWNDISYYHELSAGSSFYSIIEDPPIDQTMLEYVSLELLEVISTGIVFVDERVSGIAEKSKSIGGIEVPLHQLYNKMGIYILKDVKKGMSLSTLQSKMKHQNIPIKSCHFFVIHQGIMDKSNEPLKKWKEYIAKIEIPYKVVDSGRGKPSDLISSVRFVQVSALLKMLEDFDKFSLVQTLHSLRIRKDENGGRK